MFTVKLDEIPDEGLDLTWKEELSSLGEYLEGLSRIDFDFSSPLDAEAQITRAGKSILVHGKVQTVLHLHCVRCLQEFSHPMTSSFDLTLYPLKEASLPEEIELVGEDLEESFFEGGELHLSEIACEQIFLDMPAHPLCKEECKGLCPVCGKDLNASTCDCNRDEGDSRFSALRKLKLDS